MLHWPGADYDRMRLGGICGSEVVYLSRICVHLSQQICGVYLSCICVHLSRYPGRKGKVPPTGVTPASDSGCQNNGDSMCHLFIDIWISGQCGYFFFYNSSSLYVHTAIWSFCQIVVGPEQLNRWPCPLVGTSDTTNNQNLHNTTEWIVLALKTKTQTNTLAQAWWTLIMKKVQHVLETRWCLVATGWLLPGKCTCTIYTYKYNVLLI